MILPYFTSVSIPVGIYFVAIISFFLFGLVFMYNIQNKILKKIVSYTCFAISIFFISELLYNIITQPQEKVFTKLSVHPVEYRPENNRLYIFKDNTYQSVQDYTSQYIKPNDTIYIYDYQIIYGLVRLESKKQLTTTPLNNIIWLDSLKSEKYHKKNPTKMQLAPEDMMLNNLTDTIPNYE